MTVHTPRLLVLLCCAVACCVNAHSSNGSAMCVYNHAPFVMRFQLKNLNTGDKSKWTENYSEGKTRCLTVDSFFNSSVGDQIELISDVEWGKTLHANHHLVYDHTTNVADFQCKGSTQHYECTNDLGPTALEKTTEAIADFIEGFGEGLADSLRFDSCISDVNSTYYSVSDLIGLQKSGIDLDKPDDVYSAFSKLGPVIKDFASAIEDCVKDSKDLVSHLKDVATSLTGNVFSAIKVVVSEGVTIVTKHKDLTAQSKAMVSSWKNGDFEGSGEAVGEIVGVLIEGL